MPKKLMLGPLYVDYLVKNFRWSFLESQNFTLSYIVKMSH
jgi:hypothetical protein